MLVKEGRVWVDQVMRHSVQEDLRKESPSPHDVVDREDIPSTAPQGRDLAPSIEEVPDPIPKRKVL